ncbi:MAG: chromate efflux transporter [Chloroflexi bacterium]|nr:chromate efflux transporter [Chloroflexota bacterium]
MSVSFKQAFLYWLKLGFINFGGPTGQIAIMHSDLVEKRKWISEDHFLHALNFCMLLPGPEATQLAAYIGWLMHGTLGGVIAGIFFVLPSILVLLMLSWIYVTYGNVPAIAGIFYGIKPVVIAIVAFATYRIASRALKNKLHVALAGAAFVGIFFLQIPFPLIVLGAGLIGFAIARVGANKVISSTFAEFILSEANGLSVNSARNLHNTDEISQSPLRGSLEILAPPARAGVTKNRNIKLIFAFLILWLIPLAILIATLGVNNVFIQEYIFFTLAAFVTFGGAYAVLAYIAQAAVFQFNWLTSAQMIDGLALAETTPGPLIMVLQFVGFVAGAKFRGDLDPTLAGVIGGLLTTYVTFLPSFFFIFLGAPYIEKLRGDTRLNQSLSAITAAVVGVILNLAAFLALNVLVPLGRFDALAALIALAAFIALWKLKWEIAVVVIAGGIIGFVKIAVGF